MAAPGDVIIPISAVPNTDPQKGLRANELQTLRQKHGYNEIPMPEKSMWIKFLMKFWGLTPWILEATIVASLALRKWVQAGVVLALLITNALIGFWQESSAASALAALKRSLQVNARVLRDEKWDQVPARELVKQITF